MPYQRVSYRFRTALGAPPRAAYRWATDYRPNDFDRSGLTGRREVEWLTDDLVLLTDSFGADPFDARPGARTKKVKLVHLFPQELRWEATHLAGPARYSRFEYALSRRGARGSTLEFRGHQVEEVPRPPTPASVRARAAVLRRADAELWRHHARALADDLGPR